MYVGDICDSKRTELLQINKITVGFLYLILFIFFNPDKNKKVLVRSLLAIFEMCFQKGICTIGLGKYRWVQPNRVENDIQRLINSMA